METCSVCGTNFNGKNSRTVLLRHLRTGDSAHQTEHKTVLHRDRKTPSELKRERDARYREKNPEQAKAIKRFSRIKSDVSKELTKQHEDAKPQLNPRPQSPPLCGISESNNRYWLLEDHLDLFAGRKWKRFSWARVNQIILDHWESVHNSGTVQTSCGPLPESIFDRDSEDGDEWDSFLHYNQLIIQHHFNLRDWDDSQRNYEQKLDIWHESGPTEDQVLSLAHFRYRKKWKCHYVPNSQSGQLPAPVRTKQSVDTSLGPSPYPKPNFRTLERRVILMAPLIHEIINKTTPSTFLDRALNEGWLRTWGVEEIDCAGIEASHAGYYGPKGAEKVLTILNMHVRNLPVPSGTQSYLKLLQYVVVPEVAIRLIMEDMSVPYEVALKVWSDSEKFSPVHDDEIYSSDSD